jgi:hypothetical protein
MKVQCLIRTLTLGATLSCLLHPTERLFGDDLPDSGLTRTGSEVQAYLNSQDRSKQRAPKISDVALDTQGNLHGTFVDRQGQPRPGNLVVARQGKSRVRTAVTDEKGTFKVVGLNGGIWSVAVGSQSSLLRAWSHRTATPAAKSRLLLIRNARVVRGQSAGSSLLTMFDSGALFTVGAGVIATTVGVAGLTEASDANSDADSARAAATAANDEAAALRDQLNALGAQPTGTTLSFDSSTQGPGNLAASNFIRIDENGNVIDVDGNLLGGQLIFPGDQVILTLN